MQSNEASIASAEIRPVCALSQARDVCGCLISEQMCAAV